MTHPNFANLFKAIMAQDFSMTDLIALPASFTLDLPEVSVSMSNHIVDIMSDGEDGTELEIAWIISEAYRRTFFDTEMASKYLTADIARQTQQMGEFAEYLIERVESNDTPTPASPIAFFVSGSSETH